MLAEYAAYCRDRDEPPGEQEAATHRVLDYYVGSATHACRTAYRTYNPPPPLAAGTGVAPTRFADPDGAQRWFGRERTNLTSAITFAVERDYHEHAWRLADPVTTFFDRGGCNIDSRAVREIALRSTRATGNREAEASTLSGLGMAHMNLGDHTAAHRCLTAALRLVVEVGPARGVSSIMQQLGRVALRQGDTAAALDLFRRAMAVALRNGEREGVCWAHCRIGQALRTIDQHQEALVHLHRACRLAQEIGETSAEATSLTEIGAIHRELGDLTTAASTASGRWRSRSELPTWRRPPRSVSCCARSTGQASGKAGHRVRQTRGGGVRADARPGPTGARAGGARQHPARVRRPRRRGGGLAAGGGPVRARGRHGRRRPGAGQDRDGAVHYQKMVPTARAGAAAADEWLHSADVTQPLGRQPGPVDRSGSKYWMSTPD